MQSKKIRTNLNNFEVSFLFTLKFCAILDKNCSKKLHVKIEKVTKLHYKSAGNISKH